MDEIATMGLLGGDLCDAVEFVLGSQQDRQDLVDYAFFCAKVLTVADACKESPVLLIAHNELGAIMTTIAIKKVVAPRHPVLLEYLRDQRLVIVSRESAPSFLHKGFAVFDETAMKPRLFGFVENNNNEADLLLELVHLAAQNRAMVYQYLMDFMGSQTNPTEASIQDAMGTYASPHDAIAAYRQIMRENHHRDEFTVWNARRKIALILFSAFHETAPLRDFFLMTQCIVAPWKSLAFRFIPCMACCERDACRGVVPWVSTHCKYCAYDMGLPPSVYCVFGCDEHFESREDFDYHVHAACVIRNPFRCQVKGCVHRFPTRSLLVKHVHGHRLHTLQI